MWILSKLFDKFKCHLNRMEDFHGNLQRSCQSYIEENKEAKDSQTMLVNKK